MLCQQLFIVAMFQCKRRIGFSFKIRYEFSSIILNNGGNGFESGNHRPALLCCIICRYAAPERLSFRISRSAQSVDPIRISTDLVLVDALVTNQTTGRVISNLQADDFQLHEDKVKQRSRISA